MKSPQKLLAERGLTAQKEFGQNFLLEPSVISAILKKADLPAESDIIEIGPGLGALTIPLLELGHRVAAIELDRGLALYLEEEIEPEAGGNLTVIQKDVLKLDLVELADGLGEHVVVVGNLPYQISSPFLFRLFDIRARITKAVLMFQREMADRLVAKPGTGDYSRLSVFFAHFATVRTLLQVSPNVFYPRPKVGSTVVEIVFKQKPEPALISETSFKTVIKAGFGMRRKTLRNSLKSYFSEEEVDAALAKAGLEPGRRAETLSPPEFVGLANAMHQIMKETDRS